MLQNSKVNNAIIDQIWTSAQFLRGFVPADDMPTVILWMLSAYKDGIVPNLDRDRSNYAIKDNMKQAIAQHKIYRELDTFVPGGFWSIPDPQVTEIVHAFAKINLDDLKSNFAEVFDTLLYRLSDLQGRSAGEFLQPMAISRLVMRIADLQPNASVFNPFAGTGSFATFLRKPQKYNGQELSQSTWLLGMLRLSAYGIDTSGYANEDSMRNWPTQQKFDLVVANPPFGYRNSSQRSSSSQDYFTDTREIRQGSHWVSSLTTENFLIENGLKSLSDNGQLICLLPLSFLFRLDRERKFREALVDNGHIDTIIELSSGLFKHTSIPACIVVFKKRQSNRAIRFVDATKFTISDKGKNKQLDTDGLLYVMSGSKENAFVKYVGIDEIRGNEYNLTVKRYFATESKGTALSHFSTLLPGKSISDAKSGKVVRIRDLKDDVVSNSLEMDLLEEADLKVSSFKKIEESCLLLATRWKTLKPTYFKYEGEPIYISNDIAALRINDAMATVAYVIGQLQSDKVKEQIESYRTGTTVPMLRKDDLLNIKIDLPSLEEQRKIYYEATERYLKTVQEAVNENNLDVEDENSFLRHQIAGSLRNVRGAFKYVIQILDEQVKPQFPELDNLKIDQGLPSTFATYLNIIERDLNAIHQSVNRAGDKIELMDLQKENFDLLAFLREYTTTLMIRAKNFYEINLDLDEDAIGQFGISGIHIEGDKQLLRKMFDNIIDNAERHAFTYGIVNDNKIAIELLYDFENFEVQIDFANTGNPLPANMTHESMTRKGSSSGAKAGDGVGSWFANEVMKIHNGKFGYTDETGPEGIDSEYVTTIELTFPIIPAI